MAIKQILYNEQDDIADGDKQRTFFSRFFVVVVASYIYTYME